MRSEEECVRYAGECWDKGFNCAESAFRGVLYGLGVELPEHALKVATPFGGGIGKSEDACGALTGGVMGIGIALGRSDPKVDKMPSYKAAKELHDKFIEAFGSSSCRVLNQGDFTSDAHEVRCKRYTLESARIAYRVLASKK